MAEEIVKFELTDHDLEILQQIHHATALKELVKHPGWKDYLTIIDTMLKRLEEQHLNFTGTRDAYWVSGMRLAGIKQFSRVLKEEIFSRIDLLDQPFVNPNKEVDLVEFDGEFQPNQKSSDAQGDE